MAMINWPISCWLQRLTEQKQQRDFTKGQTVEARYNGRGKAWYKGTITKCFANYECDVLYDNGDTDHRLSVEFIRGLDN